MSLKKKFNFLANLSGKPSFLFLSLAAVVVLGFWAVFQLVNPLLPQPKEATLILVLENIDKKRMFQGEVTEGMTILEALIASSEAGNIKLEYSFNSSGSPVIESLNGYDSKKSSLKPSFYLNDSKIDSGQIHYSVIEPGDVIKITLEDYEPI